MIFGVPKGVRSALDYLKEENARLDEKVAKLAAKFKEQMEDEKAYTIGRGFFSRNPSPRLGLPSRVKQLEKENEKLKGIVAELVDYVYADKGDLK